MILSSSLLFSFAVEAVLHTCDFQDSSICDYQQDKNDKTDWSRTRGSTASVNTGPANDHTYNTAEGK